MYHIYAMHLFSSFLHFFDDMASLFRQGYSPKQLRAILHTYVTQSLRLSCTFTTQRNTLKHTRICGYMIATYNLHSTHYVFREIFIRGEYHFRECAPDAVFLDCGANIGIATVYFTWLYPHCTVHAFEPDPYAFALLEKNVAQNNISNVTIHNTAVGAEDGMVTFFADAEQSGSLRMGVGKTRAHGVKTLVPMKTLSPYITKDVYIKIDTEGSEMDIVQELTKTGMISNIKEMVIEYHHKINNAPSSFSSMLATLERAGFEYQITCTARLLTKKNMFQDIMVFAYRPNM